MESEKVGDVQILNPKSLSSLEAWVQKTSIKLVQVNGQRKYGGPPPGWNGPAPGSGCEVYISRIPRDVYEDRLIPLFQAVAPLYEFRLMMNFSGQNRGFAYAKYGDPQSAGAAVCSLHGHELQEGVHLVVRHSTEKRQLCLEELPTGMKREQLLQVLRALSEGVESVTLKATRDEKSIAAVVLYASHYAASMAKKVLCEEFKRRFGIAIGVKWLTFAGKPKKESEGMGKALVSPPPGFAKKAPKPCPLPHSHRVDGELLPVRSLPFSAVGHPLPPKQAAPPGREIPGLDAVSLLQGVCDLFNLGPPRYDVRYSHAEPGGFLCFVYQVVVPGAALPITGTAHILPGSSPGAMREEVCCIAAEHVLTSLKA
ncbi:dead end protein 1 [Scleropages formosus]|nr:dead end protein homolog 1 [Scleropages formosus]